jgi:hypothetical protein
MSKSSRLASAVISLLIFSLACSLGSSPNGSNTNQQPGVQQPAGTPLSATQAATLPPIASTFPPIASPPPATQSAITSTIGATAQPTESTAAPQVATTSAPKPPAATATQTKVPATSSPLTVNYEVVKISRLADNQATLTLHVIATGGAGGYKYYNDNVLEPGDTFDVPGQCGHPFTHTIKVQAADGQFISLPYQVQGQCPAATATPP